MIPGYSGGWLPGRSTEEGGREEEEEEKNSEERQMRYDIAQEVVIGIKDKASVHEEARSTAHSRAGQSVKQRCDCSQVENPKGGRGVVAIGKPDGSAMVGRREVGEKSGTKKDGRKLFEDESNAKGTGVSGA